MDYDAEMQYIYGDLEPLEESKCLVLHDWESKPHNSVVVKPKFGVKEEPLEESEYLVIHGWESKPHNSMAVELKFEAEEESWGLHPQNRGAVEQSPHAEAESASRLLLESNNAGESIMTMQPETDRAAPEENFNPKIGSDKLRIQPCGNDSEASEPTLAQTEPQLKHNAGILKVENDFLLPNFVSNPLNSMSGEQKFQAEVESAVRFWSHNSSVVEQNVKADEESASRLLPDLNFAVEESAPDENCEPKSWEVRLRIQPCDDDFEAFEPTLAQTKPQWKPNDGSPILKNDLTLPNFDSQSHNSMTLEPRLPTSVEFGLRLQTQCSVIFEQNVQAEAESASRVLPESNPVREMAMTMQPEGDGAASEEKYGPKNGYGRLRTPPCGDHIEASKPTSAQADPQIKRKAGSSIIVNDHFTCLPEDSAVIRKAKQRINSVGHVDKEEQ